MTGGATGAAGESTMSSPIVTMLALVGTGKLWKKDNSTNPRWFEMFSLRVGKFATNFCLQNYKFRISNLTSIEYSRWK